MVVLNKLIVKNTEYNKSKSPIAILSILSCLRDLTWVLPHIRTAVALGFIFGFLGPVRDVSVAFVIRRGEALWRISELLSQLILSMRSGMFFFDCSSEYVVLTRSLVKWYEINNIVN